MRPYLAVCDGMQDQLQLLQQPVEEAALDRHEADYHATLPNLLSRMVAASVLALGEILGFAQLMESQTPAPGKSQQESISQILRAGWHLLKLTNEILALTKIASRRIPPSKEPVQLGEVLGECQSMCDPQAQQRGIARCAADTPQPIGLICARL